MRSNLAIKDREEEFAYGMAESKIGWRSTEGKGRGVFALADIRKGEIVETSPAIPVAKENVPEADAPDGYVLEWDEDTEGEEYCMALGYIMLYNHSDNPNLEFEMDYENYTVSAKAIRDISAGEELTWDYNCELWFNAE